MWLKNIFLSITLCSTALLCAIVEQECPKLPEPLEFSKIRKKWKRVRKYEDHKNSDWIEYYGEDDSSFHKMQAIYTKSINEYTARLDEKYMLGGDHAKIIFNSLKDHYEKEQQNKPKKQSGSKKICFFKIKTEE